MLALVLLAVAARAEAPPPAWAFPVPPPGFKAAPDDGALRHVPDSAVRLTVSQVRDYFSAPDWHPEAHPPMPEVVARGRRPDLYACGFCHRAEGTGGPENSDLAGLPAAYIVRQLRDYRSGARTSTLPERLPQKLMIALSKQVTDAEAEAAAAYFSSLRPRQRIRVVESETAPRTAPGGWHLVAALTGEREPIGSRIVEVPEDAERFENRDPRARFVAYVPPGSLARGEALVATGAGKTVRCATCHGPELKGVGATPSIVGRSPSYVVRQLVDFQGGARAGPLAAQMKPTVARLDPDDLVAIAAYLASRAP